MALLSHVLAVTTKTSSCCVGNFSCVFSCLLIFGQTLNRGPPLRTVRRQPPTSTVFNRRHTPQPVSDTVRGAVSRCCRPASSPGVVLIGRTLPMKDCARLYHCARCRCQVVICRRCDRGNIYCFDGCADQARTESQRLAGQRYQSSLPGRHKHADRQRHYRQRLKAKVTHQGSPPIPADDVLPLELKRCGRAGDSPVATPEGVIRCHPCGQICSSFVRLTVLRDRYPRGHPPPRSSSRSVHRSA